MKKFILIILDGYGLRAESEGNASFLANTPYLDKIKAECPMVQLECSGNAVGLPAGVMGNSEVGHQNIGAGRIVDQDLVRINKEIQSDVLKNNPRLKMLFSEVLKNQSTLHLIGLFSDEGVHGHIAHLEYIIHAAKEFGLTDVAIHAITDGRDTPPNSAVNYMREFIPKMQKIGVGRIASICGRYFAMDRDSNWDRIEKAYRMFVALDGEKFVDPVAAINQSYAQQEFDEFITPKIIGEGAAIKNGDGVFTFNYRSDRMKEITRALNDRTFSEFPVEKLDINYVTMTKYQEDFHFPVLFPKLHLTNIFPEILANNGYKQLRIAETEKYAHVTYFFNGGEEQTFENENRILIPSPKVATYDLQPEMSAPEVTKLLLAEIETDKYDAVILNFANPDMVGHTGKLTAAIQAIETIDVCLKEIVEAVHRKNGTAFITADHGNLEMMTDPKTGMPHTYHTTLPVPFILNSPDKNLKLKGNGKLSDIAPTIIDFLQLEQPPEMTGKSLLDRK